MDSKHRLLVETKLTENYATKTSPTNNLDKKKKKRTKKLPQILLPEVLLSD